MRYSNCLYMVVVSCCWVTCGLCIVWDRPWKCLHYRGNWPILWVVCGEFFRRSLTAVWIWFFNISARKIWVRNWFSGSSKSLFLFRRNFFIEKFSESIFLTINHVFKTKNKWQINVIILICSLPHLLEKSTMKFTTHVFKLPKLPKIFSITKYNFSNCTNYLYKVNRNYIVVHDWFFSYILHTF